MLKTYSESILVHTYHKHIVDLIIQKCISKNIKVEFIRLETHYDGDFANNWRYRRCVGLWNGNNVMEYIFREIYYKVEILFK